MKNIYAVFSKPIAGGKRYAYTMAINIKGNNLYAVLNSQNADICEICETRKQADEMANRWNEDYKANGTSIFN